MHTPKRISRILTALILATMLLPWGSGSLIGTAQAACPVTAENWQEVGADSACAGGISDNSGASWVSSVAVAPDGTPYIAWDDNSSEDCEIYVRRWNGSSWEEVGAGSASDGLCAPTAHASATWRASQWTRTTSLPRESKKAALRLAQDRPFDKLRTRPFDWRSGRSPAFFACWHRSWWGKRGGGRHSFRGNPCEGLAAAFATIAAQAGQRRFRPPGIATLRGLFTTFARVAGSKRYCE